MSKQNCWEANECGRQPGGVKVASLGVCPAASDTRLDGLNGGQKRWAFLLGAGGDPLWRRDPGKLHAEAGQLHTV